jgi:hypothetical protein
MRFQLSYYTTTVVNCCVVFAMCFGIWWSEMASTSSSEILQALVALEQFQVLSNPIPLREPTSPSPSTPATSPSSPSSLLQNEARLATLASSFSSRLREYEEIMTWSKLDPLLTQKFISIIEEYLYLMQYKKSSSCLSRLCQCFSSAKKSKYQPSSSRSTSPPSSAPIPLDEQYALMETNLLEGIFLLRLHLLDSQFTQLSSDYQYAQQFSQILSETSSSTAFFTLPHQDTLQDKYFCREKLRKLFYSLNEYRGEFIVTRLGRVEESPKRFRDIQEALQESHEKPEMKREYRRVNHLLHDLCLLGTKLLVFKCEEKGGKVSDLMCLAREIESDEKMAVAVLDGSYSTVVMSRVSSRRDVMRETIESSQQRLYVSLVELSHRWSSLRANITAPTFLSAYFGSGDEDLDELFPHQAASSSKTPGAGTGPVGASASSSSDQTEESFSLQMKKIFLDSFNNNTPTPPPSTHLPVPTQTSSTSTHSPSMFFTITSDSTHSSQHSSYSLEGEGEGVDSEEKILQLKNKFKSSFSSVAQKASKAAASAAAIASNSTQKAVTLASEAKNKVTNRPRRGSGGGRGGTRGVLMMTGSYTALVDMN